MLVGRLLKMSWNSLPPYAATSGTAFLPIHSAACFCKRVKFEVRANPVASKICDCKVCMNLHGAPMQWAALFHKTDVRFTQGTEHLRFYSPSSDTVQLPESRELPVKVSCSHCGSWLADEGRRMFMTFPPLFDFVQESPHPEPVIPPSFQPQCHIFHGSHVLELKRDIPKFLDDRRTVWPGTATQSDCVAKAKDILAQITPPLTGDSHKGQQGRIAVLGGSRDYTGAPYYAGMAALRTGAELLFVLTSESACVPIKCYSPELMVSPVYGDSWGLENNQKEMVARVVEMLPRTHAMVVGPGLGRDDRVLSGVAKIIEECKSRNLPLVIDADGLFLIQQRPELIQGYRNVILTPNKPEFERLRAAVLGKREQTTAEEDEADEVKSLATALGHVTIVRKGQVDIISDGILLEKCDEVGGPRRSGGIGDVLAGTTGLLHCWAHSRRETLSEAQSAPVMAAFAACVLLRVETREAFSKHKRAMTAPDLFECVSDVFERFCPSKV